MYFVWHFTSLCFNVIVLISVTKLLCSRHYQNFLALLGEEFRYVIDYYHDESSVTADELPKEMKDVKSMKSIRVDVRPALDGPVQLFDRIVKMPWLEYTDNTALVTPSFFPPSKMKRAEQEKIKDTFEKWNKIQSTCERYKDALTSCGSDEECGKASIALQKCTATIACPSLAVAFEKELTSESIDTDKLESAFASMSKGVEMFQSDLKVAMEASGSKTK